jgi:hypothetical protein
MSVHFDPPTASLAAPGGLRVVQVDAGSDPRWDAFVADHPDALVYHHPAWLRALEREYGQSCIGLVCEDGAGVVRGVLPLVHTRGLPLLRGGVLTRRRLSSLPRTPVAGPLAVDDVAAGRLLRAAVELVDAEPATTLQLKTPTPAFDGLVDGLVRSPWRLWYVLGLPRDPDEIRFGNSRHHGRIRASVRRSAERGLTVRAAETKAELKAWYRLYLEALRWHSVPPRSFRFFGALWEHFQPLGMLELLLAERRGSGRNELLAGSIFLSFGETVYYVFNGRQRGDHDGLRPNDAIQWHAIHEACRNGFRRYDLGEVVESQTGLHAFKSKWGAEARRLNHYYYPAPEHEQVDTLEMNTWPRRIAKVTWRRLPLTATAALGDLLYRYL